MKKPNLNARHDTMKSSTIKIGLLLCLTLTTAAWAARPARPNIVVLVADDWGFSDVGAFGGEIATPNLDNLAQRGVRFSNFHVAASCSPTRAMLLTGVDNHRNGHGNLRETMPSAHLGQPGYQATLTANVVTVASLLQARGYRTAITGKWNVGNEPENLPNRRGFDQSFVMGDTGSDNWEPEKRYLPHNAKVNWFENGLPPVLPKQFYTTTFFIDKAIEYISTGRDSGQPFFAYVGFQANHVPVQAPQSFIDKYKGRYDGGWTALREARRLKAIELGLVPKDTPMVTMSTTRDWAALSDKEKRYQARLMEVYAAMADALDHEVGRLIAHLKSTGEFDNTVFVFLSDNGPEGSDYKEADLWLRMNYTRDLDRLGGPGAYVVPGPSWSSASASPFKGFKFYASEGGIRSPLIISGAATSSARNQVHAGLTHVTDIVPTLLDLAGVEHPGNRYQGQPIEGLTGRSLLPVLADPSVRVRKSDESIGYELAGNKALFKGDLKLVWNNPPVGDSQWRLYNLSTDPGETKDLQKELPEQFAAMQIEYAAWAKANAVLPMPEGYNPVKQVFINSVMNYWLPTYWPHGVATALGLLGFGIAFKRRAQRRKAA